MSDEEDTLRTAQRLRLVVDRLRRVVRQAGLVEGLSRTEEATLSRLERVGPLTTAELADRERLRSQTMSTVVRSLVGRGLVRKTSDPSDRRRENVHITQAGLAMMASVNELRDRDLAILLERELSARQREQMAETLSWLEDLGNRR
ncbi:MarR family winged helix-turn-helix transcriptional regulator [Brooklawnia cerclae]|uniref:DNA-binding MarR family transcriptional regulator n=1 Tax=Brooklawnia cerclae TaxID=349934 RepID=A0ABX0SHV5_9ACTN|nr:MarR family transcriptional regulator [Brooklawnia cerclae]NIH57972.1 DNA-binding MarR family transcriptional regulator [Brooklawnia cerclae]